MPSLCDNGTATAFVSFVLSGSKSLEKPADSPESVPPPAPGPLRLGPGWRCVLGGLVCLGLFGGGLTQSADAQQAAAGSSVYRRPAAAGQSAGGEGVPAAGQPERIVAAMLAELAQADSISARVRQRTRVGQRVLVGTGRYLQQGRGEDQRFRLETVTTAEDATFELLELSDGLSFWKFQRNADDPPRLERADIARVRDKLEEFGPIPDGVITPYLGGIQRSLAQTRQWFQFSSAEAATLENLPVWRVEGRWIPAMLSLLLPEQAEAAKSPAGILPWQLPQGMPWSVELVIGSRQLFPFRVEWRAVPGQRPVSETAVPEAFAVLELYDVRLNEPVDSAAFVYRPNAEGLVDTTEAVVTRTIPLRP